MQEDVKIPPALLEAFPGPGRSQSRCVLFVGAGLGQYALGLNGEPHPLPLARHLVDVLLADLGGDTGQQPPKGVRLRQAQAEAVAQAGKGGFDSLADAAEPASGRAAVAVGWGEHGCPVAAMLTAAPEASTASTYSPAQYCTPWSEW